MTQNDADFIRKWVLHACEKNGANEIAENIKYEISTKMTERLAIAYLDAFLIRFSKRWWGLIKKETKINLIIHETSHIIINWKMGEKAKPHGNEWKRCVLNAGQTPIVRY